MIIMKSNSKAKLISKMRKKISKLNKSDIIGLMAISAMLNAEKWKTPDLITELNNVGELRNYKDFENDYRIPIAVLKSYSGEITNQNLSRSLKSLEEGGIIKRETVPQEGRGPDPKVNYLIQTPDALYLILKKINDFRKVFRPLLINKTIMFGKILINSNYGHKLVNKELLEKFTFIKFVAFEENEIEIVYKIIKSSPSALFFLLEVLMGVPDSQIPFPNAFSIESENRKILYSELLLRLGADIIEYPHDKFKTIHPLKFEFKVSFNNGESKSNNEDTLGLIIGENEIKSILTPKQLNDT